MKVKVKGTEERITVPCGKCMYCKINRQQSMAIRVYEEKKDTVYSVFLTLTYSDEYLPLTKAGNPVLDITHVQKYLKRVRKALDLHNIKLRYLFVGEYGDESYRPHYHALIFTNSFNTELVDATLKSKWEYGYAMVGTVTSKSINYTLKYCLKQGVYYDEKKAFDYMQKREDPSRIGLRSFGEDVPDLSQVLRSPQGSSRWQLLEDDPKLQESYKQLLRDLGPEHLKRFQIFESISEIIGDPFSGADWSQFVGLDQDFTKPFQTYSRNPGIGYFALGRMREEDNYYVKQGGVKAPMPRYFREKLWTDEHKDTYRQTIQTLLAMDSEQNSEESVRLRQERYEQFVDNLKKNRLYKKSRL